MTYNPSIPQPEDIPAFDSQPGFLSDFSLLNQYFGVDHIPFGNTIVGITVDAVNTGIFSPNHNLSTGMQIIPTHMAGKIADHYAPTQWSSNGNTYTVTVVDANNFTILYDSTAQPPYIANSGDLSVTTAGFPYGYHTKLSLSLPIATPNPFPSSSTAIYSKLFQALPASPNLAELDWLNSLGEVLLSNSSIVTTTPTPGIACYGFVTPWDIIINSGYISLPLTLGSQTVTFAIPFTNPPLTVILAGSNQVFTCVTGATATTVTITPIASQGVTCSFLAIGR